MEFLFLFFTHMLGESYPGQLRVLLHFFMVCDVHFLGSDNYIEIY